MALDLEIVGEVRELTAEEAAPASYEQPVLKSIKDSHHAVARLMAAGLSDVQISLQTGYSPMRVCILRHDPTFRDLLEHYRNTRDAVAQSFEYKMMLVAQDADQILHERIMDSPEQFTNSELIDVVKVHADRAGFAPIQRTISKNLNVNIGDKMDAARARLAKDVTSG